MFLRPIRRFVLLVDEQDEVTADGIILPRAGTDRLDYVVAAVGSLEHDPGFGVGDTVVLEDPNAGRRVRLDGVVYRLVRVTDVIGVTYAECSASR